MKKIIGPEGGSALKLQTITLMYGYKLLASINTGIF
jgi:hypothetical protein